MPSSRPESENPPDVLYNNAGAARYTGSTRVQAVQRAMTLRALELIDIPADRQAFLLDVGCGSGISSDVLREKGHAWIGVDISGDMLALAKTTEENDQEDMGMTCSGGNAASENNEGRNPQVDLRNVKWGLITEGGEATNDEDDTCSDDDNDSDTVSPGPSIVEVLRGDMGQGLPFRPGSFDGAVSISAVQWLCQSDSRGQVPKRRLRALFQCLYNALRRGAKAALQFYPSNVEQVHMITQAALMCGFVGGVVIDFPHSTKAKKYYLVVQAGQVSGGFVPRLPLAANEEEDSDVSEFNYNEDEEEEGEDEEEGGGDGEYSGQMRMRVGKRVQQKRSRSCASRGTSKRRRKDNRPVTGTKDWVLLKKAERRKFGLRTTEDSKYTMRRRRPRF